MLPNFIIVGAEKAGTTTLASILSEHPEVFICKPKEPRFFTYHNWERGLKWYSSLFDDAGDVKAIGEASPAYTWAPESIQVPKRINIVLGNIKYIYIVRHPVERMISHYRHALYNRWFPDSISFMDALELRPGLKNCSKYYYQIEQYLPYTEPYQWHIVLLENLIKNPITESKRLFRFLEIDEDFCSGLKHKNPSDGKLRMPLFLMSLKKKKNIVSTLIMRYEKQLLHILGEEIKYPLVPNDVYDSLFNELHTDILKLSQFCNEELFTLWK